MIWTAVEISLGLATLVVGAEMLVRGASRLAVAMAVSPLVIGLTVVAFGTSAPELAVSVQSAWNGNADLALGNVVGSNIFNVLFILGLSALIVPLAVSSQLIRCDVPIMVFVSMLLLALGLDGRLGRVDGTLLFVGIIVYTCWSIRQSRRESREIQSEFAHEMPRAPHGGWQVLNQVALIVTGLVLLGLGARWLVDGAVHIAASIGVSELIVGLTIVAAGTSLPELVTSIVAAYRGERDIAVGNVVGSNIFNILCVLGLSSLMGPQGVGVSYHRATIRHSRHGRRGHRLFADFFYGKLHRALGGRAICSFLWSIYPLPRPRCIEESVWADARKRHAAICVPNDRRYPEYRVLPQLPAAREEIAWAREVKIWDGDEPDW